MSVRYSVIVPCRNEARYIGACLDSILASGIGADAMEILVVDGHSDDETRDVVKRYAATHAAIRLLDNPRRIVPAALNIGLRAARGTIVLRMDAHVVYPPAYIPRLAAALRASGADNVGACVVTAAAEPGPVARAIALVLAHPFGVGTSYFRIGTRVARWVDTVPFGCWRRDVFDRIGGFDEELVRNQDDEFNHRLLRHGGRILLVPDVVCTYYARGSFDHVARMYYQYGYFKPLVARKVGRVMTWRQLAPPALVAVLAAAPLGVLWIPWAAVAAATVLAYAALVAACAATAAPRHGARCALALAAAFPILHVSYGVGFWRGLWDLVRRRRRWSDPAAVPLSR